MTKAGLTAPIPTAVRQSSTDFLMSRIVVSLPHPRREIRNPSLEIPKKTETEKRNKATCPQAPQISGLGFLSDFGFRSSDLAVIQITKLLCRGPSRAPCSACCQFATGWACWRRRREQVLALSWWSNPHLPVANRQHVASRLLRPLALPGPHVGRQI